MAPSRRFAVGLAAIALGSLVLRVVYVLAFRDQYTPFFGDSVFYSKAANVLAQGGGFFQPLTAFSKHPVPAAEHPPLYIVWLAIPSALAGGRELSQTTQMLWTCVLGTGTVVVIGLAGRRIAGASCGLLAAALAALYPNIWVHDGELLSESIAIFTVSLIIWFAYRFVARPTFTRVLLLGAACGLAALTRPELLLAVVLVLVPVVMFAREMSVRTRILSVLAGGAAAGIVIAPWVGYNLSRFEEPVTISINFGATLSAANCHDTYYGPHLGYKNYQCGFRANEKVIKPGMDASQAEKALRAEAMRYIRAHESRVPVVVLARLGRIVDLYHPTTDIDFDTYAMHREPAVAWSTLVSFYVMAPLAIAGAVILRRRRVPILPLVAFPVIVLISVAMTFAQLRYRAPAEPAIALLAAVAVLAIIRRFAPPRGADRGEGSRGDGESDGPGNGGDGPGNGGDGGGGHESEPAGPAERAAMPVGAA